MKKLLFALLLIPSAILAEDNFKNPDGAASIGVNHFRSPLHADNGALDDRMTMFDLRVPMSPRISWSAGLGRRAQRWSSGSVATEYSGYAYSVGLRFYLDDPYSK